MPRGRPTIRTSADSTRESVSIAGGTTFRVVCLLCPWRATLYPTRRSAQRAGAQHVAGRHAREAA